MHFVPYPQRRPLLPIASIEVIGGVDELSRGQGWFWTPASTLLSWLKLLLPNGAQGGDGRQRFYPVRGGRSVQRCKQHPAIGTDLIGVLLAFFLLLGQAFMLQSLAIPLHPFDWHMSKNPIRCYLGEHIQHIDHGLSHAQRAVERTDLG